MNTSSRPFRVNLAAVALICALGHAQVQAEASSSATVGAYQYVLVDLTPDDGIAPSITWGDGQVAQSLSGSLSTGVAPGGGLNSVAGNRLSQTISLPLNGTPSLSYAGYTVSSSEAGDSISANVSPGGVWTLKAQQTRGFTLGANTAVTFTALARTSLGVTVPEWAVITTDYGYKNNGYFDWAPLQAGANAILFVGNLPHYSDSYIECQAGCVAADGLASSLRSYSTIEQGQEKLLQVTLTNATSNVLSSQIGTVAYSSGYAAAPIMMVPEPASLMQMLLGLIGVGLAVGTGRRRAVSAHSAS